MLDILLATVGTLGVVVAAFSARMRSYAFTPPMLALLLGILLGPEVLGLVVIPEVERIGVVHTATRLLLAVGLMAVALRYPIGDVRRRTGGVALLLVVVMPLMAAATSVGAFVLGVPMAVAVALGSALSPTDPVLASGVVTGASAEEAVPERLREVLSLESGANDGLALPFVVAAVAIVGTGSYVTGFLDGLVDVVVGATAGAVMGGGAGWLMRTAERHRDVEEGPRLLFTLVLALAVLGAIELLHGNAILGVFVSGLVFSATVTGGDRRAAESVDEGMNHFLVLPVFALFGAVLPWDGWGELGWGGAVFVAAALLLRRLPWVLLLARPLRLGWRDAVWLGWFGPIGVAALFYLAYLDEHGVTDPVVWHAGTLTVVVSTVVHGVTPGLGRRLVERPDAGAAGGSNDRSRLG